MIFIYLRSIESIDYLTSTAVLQGRKVKSEKQTDYMVSTQEPIFVRVSTACPNLVAVSSPIVNGPSCPISTVVFRTFDTWRCFIFSLLISNKRIHLYEQSLITKMYRGLHCPIRFQFSNASSQAFNGKKHRFFTTKKPNEMGELCPFHHKSRNRHEPSLISINHRIQ